MDVLDGYLQVIDDLHDQLREIALLSSFFVRFLALLGEVTQNGLTE